MILGHQEAQKKAFIEIVKIPECCLNREAHISEFKEGARIFETPCRTELQ